MTVALALAALLALAAVLVVALPFLRDPEARDDELHALGELERRRLELVEERDRAVAALAELEFDHRTGKVSEDDYRALVGQLRSRAAAGLRALEPGREPPEAPEPVPAPQPYEPAETPPEPVELPSPEPPDVERVAVPPDARAIRS
ncbi:MAG: hypothetical protein ICV59_07395 [Thermoleophilia bacterium]|nr:hypothetical protein [Thermoleophilia bacterium]